MKRLGVIESDTGIGGAEINLLRLAPALKAADWDLVVFVPGEGRLSAQLDQMGIRWVKVNGVPFKSTSRYLAGAKLPDPVATLYNTFAIGQWAFRLACLLTREKVTLVHTNSILSHLAGGISARRARLPCIWHLQDIVDARSGLYLFRPALLCAANVLPAAIVCISEAVARQLAQVRPLNRVRVVYNGVDTQMFATEGDSPFRRDWLGDRFTMVVGQVARLTPWKGPEVFLELAQRARKENLPIRFVLVGEDSAGLPGYQDHLRALALKYELGDQVVFLGWWNSMPEVYRSLDLLVHPVLEPEPFGLVLAEAMACGKPVAFFDAGGASEVVGAGNCGIHVTPGDTDGMWQAVRWVYGHPVEAKTMGHTGRVRIVSEFSLSRFTEKMLEVYDAVEAQR